MEHQLQEIRNEDAQSGDSIRSSYPTDFRLVRDWKETGDSLQYDLLASIGEKPQQYSIATRCVLFCKEELTPIADAAWSQALESDKGEAPSQRELESWLLGLSMGNNFLNDIEDTILNKSKFRGSYRGSQDKF